VGKTEEEVVVELRTTTTTTPGGMPGADSVHDLPYPRDL
jgi:hypothetical protein